MVTFSINTEYLEFRAILPDGSAEKVQNPTLFRESQRARAPPLSSEDFSDEGWRDVCLFIPGKKATRCLHDETTGREHLYLSIAVLRGNRVSNVCQPIDCKVWDRGT